VNVYKELYSQNYIKLLLFTYILKGYDGDDLVNFEINLTTPSIIYDQERVALMKEKLDLAAQMQETKLFPTDFIYDHLFHFK
jgi:hypothetical protein